VATLFAISASTALANNPQYRCEPGTVDADAVAIAFPDVDVGVFSDPNNNVCTFSIGGASVSGAPLRNDISPIAEVLSQARSGEVGPLTIRLTLARSNLKRESEDVIEAVNLIFGYNLSRLKKCISALEESGEKLSSDGITVFLDSESENGGTSVKCMVISPGSFPRINTSEPTLIIYARSGNETDGLYVPKLAIMGE